MCLFIINSSCVNEMKVCKGDPQCSNMNDLKWCKNATLWKEPIDWTPIYGHSTCDLKPLPDGMASHSQVIPTDQKNDSEYHCFNRADESPYSKVENYYGNGTEDGDKTNWLQLVNTPCPEVPDCMCAQLNLAKDTILVI